MYLETIELKEIINKKSCFGSLEPKTTLFKQWNTHHIVNKISKCITSCKGLVTQDF